MFVPSVDTLHSTVLLSLIPILHNRKPECTSIVTNETAGVMPDHLFSSYVGSSENEYSYLPGKFPARREEAMECSLT
jgi:hypothetical protein